MKQRKSHQAEGTADTQDPARGPDAETGGETEEMARGRGRIMSGNVLYTETHNPLVSHKVN